MFGNFDPLYFFISLIVIVFAVGIHEYCHAKFADLAGDPTPRMMGRVTLNPLAHLDPIGSLMFIISSISGIGIGWGKPVMVRPDKMRNPRWDHFVSVAAGPLSNLLQAVVFSLLLKGFIAGGLIHPHAPVEVLLRDTREPLAILLTSGVMLNLGMFVFNLIPLGPLDGHWLVGTFMPEPMRLRWYQFNRGIGSIIFLVLVLIPSGSGADILGMYLSKTLFPLLRIFLPLP